MLLRLTSVKKQIFSLKFFLFKLSLNRKGFTIFEMLVVLAVMLSLSLVLLANYRNFTIKTTLDYNTEKVVSIIRKAQIWALTGQLIGGVRPVGGYGVHFSECTNSCGYIFFADLDGNHIYNTGDQNMDGNYNLDQNLIVQDVTPNSTTDIVFVPPLAQIFFNDQTVPDTASVVLQHKVSLNSKTVTINRVSGQINVE